MQKPYIDINEILHSLKVLSSIKEHERVSTKQGFVVEPMGRWQGIYRWFSDEDRDANIVACEKVFNRAIAACHQTDNVQSTLRTKNLKARIRTEITHALRGVQNLCVTYQKDNTTCARIQVLTDNVMEEMILMEESPVRLRRRMTVHDFRRTNQPFVQLPLQSNEPVTPGTPAH
jgi:hypothetical protein